MDNSLFKDIRNAINCMYDNNGNHKVRITGTIGKKELERNRIRMIYDLIDTILSSKVISDETRMYLSHSNYSIRQVFEEMFETDKSWEVSFNSVSNKIMYDKRKLEAELGRDILFNIINSSKDVSIYEEKIELFKVRSLGSSDERRELGIEIRKDVIRTSFKGDFADTYKGVLSTFSRRNIENVTEQLNKDKDFIGYFNYIMSGVKLSEEDNKQKEKVLKILRGQDIEDTIAEQIQDLEEVTLITEDLENDAMEITESMEEEYIVF